MPRDDAYLLDILIAARKVWDTIQSDLPTLIKLIEPLVPPE